MAVIFPFRGLRYNETKVGDLADVIAPPYDVITAEEQELLYRRSPYNLIRLEYGKTLPGDGVGANRYTRAAADLESWIRKGVLMQEKQRSFYLYRQTFGIEGFTYNRTGLIAALKLEPYSSRTVLPHEDTLAAPKEDRLDLLSSCRANFSPIFGLFADSNRDFAGISARLQQEAPLFEFADGAGGKHTLWIVQGEEAAAMAHLIAPQQIFIADGHHRYDTALQYSRAAAPESAPGSGFVLSVLVPLEDPGLVVLPFHRLLNGLSPEQLSLLHRNVKSNFEIKKRGTLNELQNTRFVEEVKQEGCRTPAMGLLMPQGAAILSLKQNKACPDELDVSLLKRLLLDPLFEKGICPESHLDFVIRGEDAYRAILNGEVQAAFILNPTPMEAVTSRALKGENMPQKSTCFYPKLPSGLVIHHLELSHGGRTSAGS